MNESVSTYDLMMGIVKSIGDIVWGLPTIIMLVGTGIWLTIRLKGLQFTKLGHSLYLALIKRKEDDNDEGDISHFQALMTALSATVGTGNIAGVATAIAIGGPGALFWMWITGLVGMVTKYAEALLAVRFRIKDSKGNMCGGPMYYITNGLGWKWMGILFAVFASIATFGIGNTVQSNSVAHALLTSFGIPTYITAIVLAVATGAVILGGIKAIGKVTSILVPVMIVFYMLGSLVVLFLHLDRLPATFYLIFAQAFTPTAAVGGFAGSAVLQTIRMGVARGLFSNESGLGSSPIAAAAAQTKNPVNQALVSMTQTFIDTIVVCTMTGLVIILSGEWFDGKTGAELTSIAFTKGLGSTLGEYIVSIGLALFAYSTLIGWSYYGEKAIEFLFGEKVIMPYRIVFTIFVAIGAVINLDLVWGVADIFNGLMALPNLVALLLLTPVIVSESNKYLK
ncbi:MAG TPA: sodium:alanine symporter family protein [Melioribacteraceae bacterium]|nr:sodium:alanine symporter family protein [Melioribacteraceae bacterium]